MNGNYNNNGNLNNFQGNNMQNSNQPNNGNQNLFSQNVNQSNPVNSNMYDQNVTFEGYNGEKIQEPVEKKFENYNPSPKKNDKKSIFIILGVLIILIILIIIIKNLISGGNDNKSISVNANQKLIECGTNVVVSNEKTKSVLNSYVIENSKIVKAITSETYYLNVPSNNITDEDVENFKKEGDKECASYSNNECEYVVDYQKGKKFKYEIILTGSLLNELNNDIDQLSENEVIEKIKEKEEKKFLSCEVK